MHNGHGHSRSPVLALRTRIRTRTACKCWELVNNLRIYYVHTWFVLIFILLSIFFILSTFLHDGQHVILGKLVTIRREHEPAAAKESMCDLPRLDPFHKSIVEFIKIPLDINCATGEHPKLFRTDFNNKLIQMVEINGSCCYKSMERTTHSDLITKFSKRCTPISRKVTIIPPAIEFIQVQCQLHNETDKMSENRTYYADMFAFVPPKKPKIKARRMEKTPNQDEQLNIVILGLDGQSHMNFIRQMPLTYSYLMQNLTNSETNTVLEMNGYAKVGDNTFPNVIPLLTGLGVSELEAKCWGTELTHFDACPFIWKNYSAAGYHTSYAEDSIWMGIFQYGKLGFYVQPTDYYLNPFVLQISSKLGHEIRSNSKICYGPRLAFEVLLDYLVKTFVRFEKLTTASEQRRFFQFIWSNSLFHDYLNHPKLGDELLYMTIEWLTKHNYLNNTMLLLVSDHGIRWGSIRSTNQGRLEERLPMLYIILPKWFEQKYSIAMQNVRINQNRLTTPFDLHETLVDLLSVEKNLDNSALVKVNATSHLLRQRGLSLFRPIPASRTCAQAGVATHWCICDKMSPISNTSRIVSQAARFVVDHVNQIISNYTERNELGNVCAKLRLSEIVSGLRKIDENSEIKDAPAEDIELQLAILVEPSQAVLEVTVYKNQATNYEWVVSGEISRLNSYGAQSMCVSDPVLQKYCYCVGHENAKGNETGLLQFYESKPLTLSI